MMNLRKVAIYASLSILTWMCVEVGYRIAIGIGPSDELTGFDLFLLPLHIAGIAGSIGIGRWFERTFWKR